MLARSIKHSCGAGYLSETQAPELQGLFAALEQECPQEIVPYRELFLQDEDLNQVRVTTNSANLTHTRLCSLGGCKPLSSSGAVHG